MENQVSLFDTQIEVRKPPEKKEGLLIQFPGTVSPVIELGNKGVSRNPTKRKKKQWDDTGNHVQNCRRGEQQTVYAIKDPEDRKRMAAWLLENKDRKYFLAYTLGINLGLRANELLQLKLTDIFNPDGSIKYGADLQDTTDGVIVDQSKTKKKRKLYLNEACINVLRWYFPIRGSGIYKDAYLFPSREGGHIEVGTLDKVLKECSKACGIKYNIGTHSLRKTYGYEHFKRTGDIIFLQRLYGHSSPLITLRYIGINEEDEKAAYHSMSIDFLAMLNDEMEDSYE